MNPMKPPSPAAQPPAWRILAELNLPLRPDLAGVAAPWLRETLRLLNLSADLSDRVVSTAGEALARAARPDAAPPAPAVTWLCLRVCVPPEALKGNSGQHWGFFHIAKADASDEGCHRIELYLYLEGG